MIAGKQAMNKKADQKEEDTDGLEEPEDRFTVSSINPSYTSVPPMTADKRKTLSTPYIVGRRDIPNIVGRRDIGERKPLHSSFSSFAKTQTDKKGKPALQRSYPVNISGVSAYDASPNLASKTDKPLIPYGYNAHRMALEEQATPTQKLAVLTRKPAMRPRKQAPPRLFATPAPAVLERREYIELSPPPLSPAREKEMWDYLNYDETEGHRATPPETPVATTKPKRSQTAAERTPPPKRKRTFAVVEPDEPAAGKKKRSR